MGTFTNLTAADGFTFPAYVAQPAGKPRGGLVVLQEIFGVNAHIRAVADGYAADGYFVVAPSTFHRVKADIQAAIDHAAQAGKVGILGYCWGDLLTWRASSALSGLSAAVPYYGGGMTTEAEAARQPKVPVMAHFGEQDRWIPMDSVHAFEKAQPGVAVHVYAANHGFNCDHRGSWNAPAAKLARERTLAFLAQHLG